MSKKQEEEHKRYYMEDHNRLVSYAEHLSTIERLAAVETNVGNLVTTLDRFIHSFEEKSKTPINAIISAASVGVAILALLAAGYVGKPLNSLTQTVVKIEERERKEDLEDAYTLGRLSAAVDTLQNEQIILRKEMADRTRNRYTKEDAHRDYQLFLEAKPSDGS